MKEKKRKCLSQVLEKAFLMHCRVRSLDPSQTPALKKQLLCSGLLPSSGGHVLHHMTHVSKETQVLLCLCCQAADA